MRSHTAYGEGEQILAAHTSLLRRFSYRDASFRETNPHRQHPEYRNFGHQTSNGTCNVLSSSRSPATRNELINLTKSFSSHTTSTTVSCSTAKLPPLSSSWSTGGRSSTMCLAQRMSVVQHAAHFPWNLIIGALFKHLVTSCEPTKEDLLVHFARFLWQANNASGTHG